MGKDQLQEHLLDHDELEYWDGFHFKEPLSEEVDNGSQDDKTIELPVPPEKEEQPRESQKQQYKTCRICFCGEEPEDDDLDSTNNTSSKNSEPPSDFGRLISPCQCKGSMKYVHLECLNMWRKKTANNNSFFKCEQCNYSYHFERTKWALIFRNNLLITFLALTTFTLLVIFAGFLMKAVVWAFLQGDIAELAQVSPDDLGDDFDLLVHRFLTDPTLLSFSHVNFVHLMAGLALVGLMGASFSVAGFGVYRMASMRRRVALPNDRLGSGGALLVVTIVVGGLKALWFVYKNVRMACIKSLEIMERRVLDIDEEVDHQVVA
ncbi:UNVERIFIED_CONTAM: hypothetical protein HDU68_001975 [Siphonaria sp. JEL0065]|nr:hypothetical protein HDU68_001975 [Siphonaria sp. JEL0065]